MKQESPNNDKSRNVTGGYNLLAQMFPLINFIMFIFGWFTVPIEVLFRRNFGQRWLTVINFYAGLLVLGAFTNIETIANASYNSSYYQQQPVGGSAEPPFWQSLMHKTMLIFLILYLLISSYHFFRMWWRDRTNTALHSFDDGTSRFEFIGDLLMQVVNIAAVPILRGYMLLLPKEERERKISVPPLIDDVTAFTNTVFEPLLLLLLALLFSGATRTWFLISAPALAIYASWKETAKLNRALDFRDSVINAETMSNARHSVEQSGGENLILKQAAHTLENNREIAPLVAPLYPDLMDIIEEMNKEKSEVAE